MIPKWHHAGRHAAKICWRRCRSATRQLAIAVRQQHGSLPPASNRAYAAMLVLQGPRCAVIFSLSAAAGRSTRYRARNVHALVNAEAMTRYAALRHRRQRWCFKLFREEKSRRDMLCRSRQKGTRTEAAPGFSAVPDVPLASLAQSSFYRDGDGIYAAQRGENISPAQSTRKR